MPNKLSSRKKRVSYAEDRKTLQSLLKICRRTKRTLTEVIREAVSDYLAAHIRERNQKE